MLIKMKYFDTLTIQIYSALECVDDAVNNQQLIWNLHYDSFLTTGVYHGLFGSVSD